MAVESFQISVGSGPGRANSKISVELVGSGKVIDSATGITMPAATTEKLLPSASLTLSINGVDYVTLSGTVTIPAGATFVDVVVTPIDDTLVETYEYVTLTLSAGSGYQVGTPSSTLYLYSNE